MDNGHVSEEEIRQVALTIMNKYPDWFTNGQIANIVGKDRNNEVIAALSFVGLLESATKDGSWKHRIVQNPQRRLEIIAINKQTLNSDITSKMNDLSFLDTLEITLKKEIHG